MAVHPSERPHRPLDEIDRRLLAVLARRPHLDQRVGGQADVSRATAYARFDRLRDDGVITGFHAEVDPAALGHTVTALILVNVDQGQWRLVLAELAKLPGVEYVALTSGGFDFVLHVRVPDVHALRDVVLVRLQGMPAVRSTQTIFVLDEQRRPLSAVEFA